MDELFTHPQAPAAQPGAAAADTPGGARALTVQAPGRQSLPLVFASPHSGRDYPTDFIERARLDPKSLRRSEDCFVDRLFAFAPEIGAPLLCALFPRAYVDPNREPYELDPSMFEGPLPDYANTRSPRVAAGLGTVARVVAGGAEIYERKLSFEEVRQRIERTYWPYHQALRQLLSETRERFGGCLLLDCHSMPSGGTVPQRRRGEAGGHAGGPVTGRGVSFVLGDCHGSACGRDLVAAAESYLRKAGYRTARNQPYAGGFITRHYGRPGEGVHALQIEINRALYMNEESLEPIEGFEALQADLKGLSQHLAAVCGELFES